MWVQGTHSVLQSQQMKMSDIYIYYLNAAVPPSHDHNDFMATDAPGTTMYTPCTCQSASVAVILLWR